MDRFEVTIWGARGSVPVSGPQFVRYGGNTSCVEVRTGDVVVVLDAGTGIVPLGRKLREEGCREVNLFLSHGHYDHLAGLATFAPLHDPRTRLTIWHAGTQGGGRWLLTEFLRPPFLPFGLSDVAAEVAFRDLEPAGRAQLGSIVLGTEALNHPGGNTALSLDAAGRRVVYACDYEHDDGPCDARLAQFLSGAHLAVLDCTYTPQDYPSHRGFGHAHWQKSAEIARRAGVDRWAAFHHSHLRNDDELDGIADELSEVAPDAFLAREGVTLDLVAGR